MPLFQNESKCDTFHMKMSSTCSFIFMQISYFHNNDLALRLAWKQRHNARELGNGLLIVLLVAFQFITWIFAADHTIRSRCFGRTFACLFTAKLVGIVSGQCHLISLFR